MYTVYIIMIIDESILTILNKELDNDNKLTENILSTFTNNLDVDDDNFYYLLYNIDADNFHNSDVYTKEDLVWLRSAGELTFAGCMLILTSLVIMAIYSFKDDELSLGVALMVGFCLPPGFPIGYLLIIIGMIWMGTTKKTDVTYAEDNDGNNVVNPIYYTKNNNNDNHQLYNEEKDDTFVQCYLNNIIKSESNDCEKVNIKHYNENKEAFKTKMKTKYVIS